MVKKRHKGTKGRQQQMRAVWPLCVLAFVLAVVLASVLRMGPVTAMDGDPSALSGNRNEAAPSLDLGRLLGALSPPGTDPALRPSVDERAEPALIAIVIDDAGLAEAATRRAMALPEAVTLSFLPYGAASPALAREASSRGHEIILHMPMAPEGAEDPGPGALRPELGAQENRARLSRALDLFPQAIGINNHMGSAMTADAGAMAPVLDLIAGRGLIFLDSRTTPATVAGSAARASGMIAVDRDIFLDNEMDAPAIGEQLAALELMARQRGVAIAIGHPHEATLAALEIWVTGLSARGFRLVPLSVAAGIRNGSLRPVALDR